MKKADKYTLIAMISTALSMLTIMIMFLRLF